MIRRSILTIGSVLALALTASVPAYAAPSPAQATNVQAITTQAATDTKLALDAKPEPIAKNGTITLAGTLKYKSGSTWRSTPGTRVLTVHFDPSGSAGPRTVARIKAVNGKYTHRVTASRSGTWVVKYSGSGSLQSARATDAVCVYFAGRWQCPVSPTNPDLDCPDLGRTVWVGTKDYHRLDADNDGWGCDSYS